MLIKLKPDMPNNNDIVLVVAETRNNGMFLESAFYKVDDMGVGRFYPVYIDRATSSISPTYKAATNEIENVIGWAESLVIEVNADCKFEFEGV
jgi:hypothetical protein